MNLNHINLSIADIPAASGFFKNYFNFHPGDGKPNDTLCVLTGANGFVLVLMNERMNQNGNVSYPDAFHIGFFLDNETEVIELFERLKNGGITLEQQPQRIRKTFGFYFHYQKIMIEIACQVKGEG